MIGDVRRLGKYPEGAASYPVGYTEQYREYERVAGELENAPDSARQMATDAVNRDWYAKVEEAFKILSRDVNGNGGQALARLFADEHPELQQLFYEALNAGMLLRHPELLRIWEEEPYTGAVGHRDKIDGRVRINTAEFVVGGRDVDWR